MGAPPLPGLDRLHVDPASDLARPDYLMRAARAAVARLARRYDLSSSDRDEVLSSTLLLAVERHRDGWAWGKRAVHFYARNALARLMARWREVPVGVASPAPRLDVPEERMVLDLRTLQQAWPILSAKQRTAFTLRLQGHSFLEIADVLGTETTNVNSLFIHARQVIEGGLGPRSEKQRALREVRTTCAHCGDPLPTLSDDHRVRGKPRMYCSMGCNSKAYRARKILAAEVTS